MTLPEMFRRLANDWDMIKNAEESCVQTWKVWEEKRVHYAMLLNDDEFYQKATDFRFCAPIKYNSETDVKHISSNPELTIFKLWPFDAVLARQHATMAIVSTLFSNYTWRCLFGSWVSFSG